MRSFPGERTCRRHKACLIVAGHDLVRARQMRTGVDCARQTTDDTDHSAGEVVLHVYSNQTALQYTCVIGIK